MIIYGEWSIIYSTDRRGILLQIVIAVVGTLICGNNTIFTTLRKVTDREERIDLDIDHSTGWKMHIQVLMVWISNKSRGDDIL